MPFAAIAAERLGILKSRFGKSRIGLLERVNARRRRKADRWAGCLRAIPAWSTFAGQFAVRIYWGLREVC
jgi:hypothetical protein